jgi:hypothetical protein
MRVAILSVARSLGFVISLNDRGQHFMFTEGSGYCRI